MKVDLHYDPVRLSTGVCIDGHMIDRHNEYGFLYPVRHCLLQTWLPESASWSGLRKQLDELARGESLAFTFYGRLSDFEDVRAELGDGVSFHSEDFLRAYRDLLDHAERALRNFFPAEHEVVSEPSLLRTGNVLFPDEAKAMERIFSAPDPPWLRIIDNEEAFLSACRGDNCCCLVKEPFLSGFIALDRLPQLTGSLLRTGDMICCAVDSDEKREELMAYARQFPKLPIRFVDESDSQWKTALEAKYGKPFQYRKRLLRAQKGLVIIEETFGRESEIQRESSQFRKAVLDGDVSKIKLRNVRSYQLRWLQKQRPVLKTLQDALNREVPAQNVDGSS